MRCEVSHSRWAGLNEVDDCFHFLQTVQRQPEVPQRSGSGVSNLNKDLHGSQCARLVVDLYRASGRATSAPKGGIRFRTSHLLGGGSGPPSSRNAPARGGVWTP